MRKKRNMTDMRSWRFFIPHKCAYCEKDAEGCLVAYGGLGRFERDLCKEHLNQWMKGELYI